MLTWEQRYRLRHLASISLALWAGLALVAAIFCAYGVRQLNQESDWALLRYSPDGARAILGMLAGSMLTFIVFVLSATLIVVQLASGQLTPRIIALVLARPGVKVSLSVLTFAYAYSLSALGRVEDHVPHLHVSIAILLNLISVLMFFQFVQHLSGGLRPASLMLLVGGRAQRVFTQVYPEKYDASRPETATSAASPSSDAQVIEYSGGPGVIMAFSAHLLMRLARDADAVVEMIPQVGDSVVEGDPLFRIFGGTRRLSPKALHGCVAVGIERTLEQDPRFAFRILVDIANKALSPAINDPTTAVLALDQIDNLLLLLGRRRLDDGIVRDKDGKLCVIYGTPDWTDFVVLGINEVRQFGEGSIQVIRRLRAMLEHLISVLPEARRPPLQAELKLLDNAVARRFPDEEDRIRAGVADYQGMGGSDS